MNSSLLALIAAAVLIVIVLALKKRSTGKRSDGAVQEVQAEAAAPAEEAVEKESVLSDDPEETVATDEEPMVFADETVEAPLEEMPATEPTTGALVQESEPVIEAIELEVIETEAPVDQEERAVEPEEELPVDITVSAAEEEETAEHASDESEAAAGEDEVVTAAFVQESREESGQEEQLFAEVDPVFSDSATVTEVVVDSDEEAAVFADETVDPALKVTADTEPVPGEGEEGASLVIEAVDENEPEVAQVIAGEEATSEVQDEPELRVPAATEEEEAETEVPISEPDEEVPADAAAAQPLQEDEQQEAAPVPPTDSTVSLESSDVSHPAAVEAGQAPTPIHLTLEVYSERLYALEERQRSLLTDAIARQDEALRDRLQRELVVMNEKIALLADSYTEEISCYQQVLQIMTQLQQEGNGSAELDEAVEHLYTGDPEKAEAVLSVLSKKMQPFAARAAYGCGRLAECRVDLQLALTMYRGAIEQDVNNADYLQAAGRVARSLYQYKEALPWLESYVQLKKNSNSRDAVGLALAQRELAYTYVLSGNYQKAGPLYKEAMTGIARRLGEDHPEMAVSWQQIGELQETLGEYDKAVALYKKAISILVKKRGTEHPSLANLLTRLAALYMELEQEKEAVAVYEQLVRIQEKALRPTHPQLAISLNNLAEAYRLEGRYGEAEACYQKILEINETVHGPEHPSVAAVLQELAKLNTTQRRPEEAKRYQERAAAIFQKIVDASEKTSDKEGLTLELE